MQKPGSPSPKKNAEIKFTVPPGATQVAAQAQLPFFAIRLRARHIEDYDPAAYNRPFYENQRKKAGVPDKELRLKGERRQKFVGDTFVVRAQVPIELSYGVTMAAVALEILESDQQFAVKKVGWPGWIEGKVTLKLNQADRCEFRNLKTDKPHGQTVQLEITKGHSPIGKSAPGPLVIAFSKTLLDGVLEDEANYPPAAGPGLSPPAGESRPEQARAQLRAAALALP